MMRTFLTQTHSFREELLSIQDVFCDGQFHIKTELNSEFGHAHTLHVCYLSLAGPEP